MILKNMREHSSALVQQAIMVSEELIRVAILWHEQWHEGLEDASRRVGWGGAGCTGKQVDRMALQCHTDWSYCCAICDSHVCVSVTAY